MEHWPVNVQKLAELPPWTWDLPMANPHAPRAMFPAYVWEEISSGYVLLRGKGDKMDHWPGDVQKSADLLRWTQELPMANINISQPCSCTPSWWYHSNTYVHIILEMKNERVYMWNTQTDNNIRVQFDPERPRPTAWPCLAIDRSERGGR